MKILKPALSFAFLLIITGTAFSQSPTPTPDDEDVVKISTKIIQFDVTVTDKKGRVVTDLRRDEIEVFENGKKQTVDGFSFITKKSETAETRKPNAPNLPSKPIRAEDVRRTIAIVVDDLTLSFESTFRVRTAIKRFIETEMREGDVIAIIRTGSGVGALQQFSNDKRQLLLAIDRIKFSLSGRMGSFEQVYGGTGRDLRSGSLNENQNPMDRDDEVNEFRRNVFAAGTLGAVQYVIKGMSELPGRKSIMLVSEGFTLFDRTGGSQSRNQFDPTRRGRVQGNDALGRLQTLIDQANRASVVVHTMDARGLEVPGITSADSIGEMSENEIAEVEESRRSQLSDTQDGLRFLARQTGGTAVLNQNDLVGGLRRILDDQSYYLVSYEPDEATFNDKNQRFNNVSVRITRPNTRVRYRSGFYGVASESPKRGAGLSAGERLVGALTSPFASGDISLRLNALFLGSKRDGSTVRSLLHIPIADLKFTDEPGGLKRAVIELIAVAFGENGEAVAQELKTHTLDITKEAYELSLDRGMVYDFSFPIKKPGAYQLRVALRDQVGDKIGSVNQFVEIPNLKKNRLAASDIFLEGLTAEAVKARQQGTDLAANASKLLVDTALRRFPAASVLNFGMAIYNAKGSATKPPNLTVQARMFRDGELVFEGKPKAVSPDPKADFASIEYGSSIALGASTLPGDYVLQLTVIDQNNSDKKKGSVTRYVQFELVK